jgi:hypothetical protein
MTLAAHRARLSTDLPTSKLMPPVTNFKSHHREHYRRDCTLILYQPTLFIADTMASNHSVLVDMTSYSQSPSSATSTGVEPLQNDPDDPSNSNEGFSLPPTDGGKDAWLCLFACFMLEALIWGAIPCFSEVFKTNSLQVFLPAMVFFKNIIVLARSSLDQVT